MTIKILNIDDMQNSQLFDIFLQLGGSFLIDTAIFSAKLAHIKAFVFDWDGVFNNGSKTEAGSPYSEVDSMGINLLRFGHWLQTGNLPTTAIMTGENNQPAFYLAKRERFQAVYFKFANKTTAFQHFLATHNLQAHEVCFCFDDVIDLSVAALCGLRVLVRRDASPLFVQYVKNQQLADYQTANTGGNFAVREVAELLLGVLGKYEKAVLKRQNFDTDYQNYLALRNSQVPQFFTVQQEQILEITNN